MQTWTYGSRRITVEGGVVVESNTPGFPVSAKAPTKTLRACGWVKVKAPVQYDAWGRKFKGGEIERR
jgi:hypothetical protein